MPPMFIFIRQVTALACRAVKWRKLDTEKFLVCDAKFFPIALDSAAARQLKLRINISHGGNAAN